MEEISNHFLDTYNIESSANNHTDKGTYLVIFTVTLSLCNEVPNIYCMHKIKESVPISMPRVCHMLVGLCCRHFDDPRESRQQSFVRKQGQTL